MAKPCRGYIFAGAMKLALFLLIMLFSVPALCQDKPVSGVVADKNTQERLATVHIQNIRTGKSIYNNLKAEFTIDARPGDLLLFSKPGYFKDTIRLDNTADFAVYLKPQAIMLRQVTIRDTATVNPKRRLELTKEAYSKVYGSLDNRDILSASPSVGAGISIDALWNIFSRSGRNAEHLRKLIDEDYHQNLIDYRFNKSFVTSITGLKEPQLTSFMRRYRPSYYMASNATDYEFATAIKANLRRFKRNPRGPYLQPLPSIPPVTAAAK